MRLGGLVQGATRGVRPGPGCRDPQSRIWGGVDHGFGDAFPFLNVLFAAPELGSTFLLNTTTTKSMEEPCLGIPTVIFRSLQRESRPLALVWSAVKVSSRVQQELLTRR